MDSVGPEPALVSIRVINARDHAQIPGLPRCSGIWGILVPALVSPFIPVGGEPLHSCGAARVTFPAGVWKMLSGRVGAGQGTPRAAGVPLLSLLSAGDFSIRSWDLLRESTAGIWGGLRVRGL